MDPGYDIQIIVIDIYYKKKKVDTLQKNIYYYCYQSYVKIIYHYPLSIIIPQTKTPCPNTVDR